MIQEKKSHQTQTNNCCYWKKTHDDAAHHVIIQCLNYMVNVSVHDSPWYKRRTKVCRVIKAWIQWMDLLVFDSGNKSQSDSWPWIQPSRGIHCLLGWRKILTLFSGKNFYYFYHENHDDDDCSYLPDSLIIRNHDGDGDVHSVPATVVSWLCRNVCPFSPFIFSVSQATIIFISHTDWLTNGHIRKFLFYWLFFPCTSIV